VRLKSVTAVKFSSRPEQSIIKRQSKAEREREYIITANEDLTLSHFSEMDEAVSVLELSQNLRLNPK
jgi:hypothetical protein